MNRRIFLGLMLTTPLGAAAASAQSASGPSPRRVDIRVDERGYHPARVPVRPGETVTLVFTRTSSRGCGGSVVIPSRAVRRELPVGRPVEITLTIRDREEVTFTCGMGMYRGALLVE
jgi:plastocyanin domain-containing protein